MPWWRRAPATAQLDEDLVQLLKDWQLGGAVGALGRAGVTSVRAIEEEFHVTEVGRLSLRADDEARFYRLLEDRKRAFETRIHEEEEKRQRQADEHRRRLEEELHPPQARTHWKWACVALAAAGGVCLQDWRLRVCAFVVLSLLAASPPLVIELVLLYFKGDVKGICRITRAERKPEIQCCGCQALARLARNTENIQAIDHEVILASLRGHTRHAGICRHGCQALRRSSLSIFSRDCLAAPAELSDKRLARMSRIAIDAHNQAKIANSDGVLLIVKAMLAHKSDVSVQKEGAFALLKISSNSDTHSKIAAADGIAVCLEAMRQFSQNSDLQRIGCEVMRHLAVNTANKQKIAEANGIEIILDSMRKHPGHPGVVMQGCWALRRIAFHPDDNQKKGADADILASILEAINLRTKESTEIGVLVQDHKKLISDKGAITIILDSMHAHEADASVQEQGCALLENLAHDYSNKQTIADAGGIAVVLIAMRTHTTHTGVQEQGCWALRNLAIHPGNRELIADSTSLANVIKENVIRDRILKDAVPGMGRVGRLAAAILLWLARTLLTMACYVGGTFAGQVMSAFRGGNVSSAPLDGVTVLLEAMRSHATNASIQTPSCGALWNLAYNADENKKKIAEAGGVSVLLDAIRSHPGNGGVQERACGALGCIGWSNKILHKRIKEAGAEQVLKDALGAPGATAVSVERSQLLLKQLQAV